MTYNVGNATITMTLDDAAVSLPLNLGADDKEVVFDRFGFVTPGLTVTVRWYTWMIRHTPRSRQRNVSKG